MFNQNYTLYTAPEQIWGNCKSVQWVSGSMWAGRFWEVSRLTNPPGIKQMWTLTGWQTHQKAPSKIWMHYKCEHPDKPTSRHQARVFQSSVMHLNTSQCRLTYTPSNSNIYTLLLCLKGWQREIQGVFFHWTSPKKLKYKKPGWIYVDVDHPWYT